MPRARPGQGAEHEALRAAAGSAFFACRCVCWKIEGHQRSSDKEARSCPTSPCLDSRDSLSWLWSPAAQRVNSDLYDTDPTSGQPHTTTSGGNSLFYITKIENPSNGKTFHFKPSRLFVSDKRNGGGWTQSWAYTAIGPWRAQDVTVAPGASKTNLGCVAVPVGAEAKKFAYFMLYDSSIDNDSVLLTRAGEAKANVEDVMLSPAAFPPRCTP
jgi:hypothetical protein